MQQNGVSALATSSLPNGEKHSVDGDSNEPIIKELTNPSTNTENNVAPLMNVASGIRPVAPYLDSAEKLQSQEFVHGSANVSAEAESPNSPEATNRTPSNGQATTNVRPNQSEKLLDNVTECGIDPAQNTDISSVSQALQSVSAASATSAAPAPLSESTAEPALASVADAEMTDALPVAAKVAREREEDDEDDEPSAKRARTQTPADHTSQADGADISSSSRSMTSVPNDGPTETRFPEPQNSFSISSAVVTGDSVPSLSKTSAENGSLSSTTPPEVDYGSITDLQTRILLEGMRNIRKSKSGLPFLKPVDPVALNIPHYLEVIKLPMDLSTMEQKLKNGQYISVNEYLIDFDQMVQNSVIFNGPEHVVTQQGKNIRSLLNAQLKRVPRPGHPPATDVSKKIQRRSISGSREIKPRLPRPSLNSRPAVAAPEQIYALDHDGMPQIRRHSSIADGRPKREIHKPPPKDLPYSAKPKKKKYQLELRFCQETLDEITRPAYANTIAAPFLNPVDPVALNIPNYRSIIKKPMDFSTVRERLQKSFYENAKDFEQDVKLIFTNCYKFNGKDHPISKMGADLERAFDEQWAKKNDWVTKHAPPSAPQSPEPDESESEDDEEEENDEEAERQAQLEAIHGQFAQLSAQLLALQNQPAKKSKIVPGHSGKKGAKASKPAQTQVRRKSSSGPAVANLPIRADKKTKSKTKKVRPITNAQKEEISEKIGLLSAEQMARAADIIKTSLRKAGRNDLAVSDDLFQ